MGNAPDKLAPLRQEIDSIDGQLHDLLMRRAEIVGEIGQQKASDGGPIFRPAREALLLRRLLARHHGDMPRAVVVRLWREIVASSIRLQSDFSVGYCLMGEHGDALRLANGQFGLDADVTRLASASQVVSAVGRDDVSVGLVPLPHSSDSPEWWAEMRNFPELHVMARLPWFRPASENGDAAGALVLAKGAPEDTGDDRTVLTFFCGSDVSRARFAELASQNDLDADTQAVAASPDGAGGRVHLADVAGFVAEDDARVRGLATLLGNAEVCWLGAYAAPFVDDVDDSKS